MRPSQLLLSLAFAASIAACGGNDSNNDPPPEPLDLAPAQAPFEIGSATFFEGISYGPYDRNLFDIYLPASDKPTPLLLYIHGGGFVGGSRNTSGDAGRINSYLDAGVAYASIEYRLLTAGDTEGVAKSVGDSTRCLQFIRYHAAQLNLDPDRIILKGVSAGAGTSLWIGFHDEMADRGSEDPVLRQPTRVTAIIANETQASYDLDKWSTRVFADYGMTALEAASMMGLEPLLLWFYGIDDIGDYDAPATMEYKARMDMLAMMDAGDPPLFVENKSTEESAPVDVDTLFHSPLHALALAERADEVGLDHLAYMPLLDIADPSGETEFEFALRHLQP